MEALLQFLDQAIAAIPLPGGVLVVVVGLLSELVMRIWPTAKPKSWLLFGSALMKYCGLVAVKLSELFNKSSAFLDGLVQNLKE